jgi:cation diffusion facilitator family transporter
MSGNIKAAWASCAVGSIVLALKFGAWWVTGSIALYSDALESIINVVAALGAVIALTISARPADASHPYGHTKAEYFSAVVEGVLVIIAALSIFREAYVGWLNLQAPSAPLLGIAVSAVATAINLAWSVFLLRFGKRSKSPALVADAKHVMTDVWTSGGVLVGFALVPLTGLLQLDPLIAALVAVNILWTGYAMVRDSIGPLMDQAADPETVAKIKALVAEHAAGAIEAHDVRTRTAGHMTFVSFDLVVPTDMPVGAAHDICDRVEMAIRQEMGVADISIHVEPGEHARHRGIPVLG